MSFRSCAGSPKKSSSNVCLSVGERYEKQWGEGLNNLLAPFLIIISTNTFIRPRAGNNPPAHYTTEYNSLHIPWNKNALEMYRHIHYIRVHTQLLILIIPSVHTNLYGTCIQSEFTSSLWSLGEKPISVDKVWFPTDGKKLWCEDPRDTRVDSRCQYSNIGGHDLWPRLFLGKLQGFFLTCEGVGGYICYGW